MGEWMWSWNGSSPNYMINSLFIRPLARYIRQGNVDKYALMSFDSGHRICAYIFPSKKRFSLDAASYVRQYRRLIKKTDRIMSMYQQKQAQKKASFKDIIALSFLLEENACLYLMSQPENIDCLIEDLARKIRKQDPLLEKRITDIVIPEETILDQKNADFKELISYLRKKGAFGKDLMSLLEKDRLFRRRFIDFHSRYRSFYMVSFSSGIEDEYAMLIDEIARSDVEHAKNLEKRTFPCDGLPKDILRMISDLRALGALRLEAKNAWINLALLINDLIKDIGKSKGISFDELYAYDLEDIKRLMSYPTHQHISHNETLYMISKKGIKIHHDSQALKLYKMISSCAIADHVEGSVAVEGTVRGTAFVVGLSDNISAKMKEISDIESPILVAEQTVPAYLPLIRRCVGIITNEGGVLSHAAIVSREYHIPALIGTKNATDVFKTGDHILIDTSKKRATRT